LFTAYRETWEEIGVDLAEKEFVQVGRLDEREITTSLGKRLLMILSPFGQLVVLMGWWQLTGSLHADHADHAGAGTSNCELGISEPKAKLTPQTEVSSLHWIPLPSLTPPFSSAQWSHIPIDISTRLSPRNQLVQRALRSMVGTME